MHVLCGQPQFQLPASLLLSSVLELVGAHLPSEVMFEGEGTPGLARADILSAVLRGSPDVVRHSRTPIGFVTTGICKIII
jgi:hypothetical protein